MRPTRFEIFVLVVVVGLAAYVVVPMWRRSRAQAMQATCLSNLQTIGAGLSAYLEANDSTWPYVGKLRTFSRYDKPWPILPVALKSFVKSEYAYRCPADSRQLKDDALRGEFGAESTWYATEGLSYEWIWPEAYAGRQVGHEELSRLSGRGKGRADQDLLRDFEAFHVGLGGANTLYADFIARPDVVTP
ncbi:MAG: hypothetical protein H6819_02100 [Phycisphaerales bacterium]|nr:hypothetical protein [Phycisphaerales bacterium]MCB9856995.1 hypothetical protein [Phycisphaerales bacterium]MCB9861878.1 hypothetical protein [Phycisphaerales bacterium]